MVKRIADCSLHIDAGGRVLAALEREPIRALGDLFPRRTG